MRLFIAIVPPKEVQKELAAAQAPLSKLVGLKLVEQENIHITTKFLGEVENADKIKAALAEVVKGKKAFVCRPKGVSAFPSEKRPRVIWVGAEGHTRIIEIQAAIDAALAPLGFPEEKDFAPHFTLARVKAKPDMAALAKAIESLRSREFSEFKVTAIILMQSTLTKKGPIYQEVARFELEPADE